MTATSAATTPRREITMWLLWAVVVSAVAAFAVWALHILVDAPHQIGGWWAIGAVTFAVPAVASQVPLLRSFAAQALRTTVMVAGLTAMVLAVYVLVVVGLGDTVDGTEHRVLGLSMVAGATAVALAPVVRSRLRDATQTATGSVRPSATAALTNFGARMTRSVPMDELLLQLTETLRETMAPLGAELWTGADGVLDRTTSVPDRGPQRIRLNRAELAAVTGARVSGTSWVSMWLPTLLEPLGSPEDVHIRVAPITHLGNLLGLIVVARPDSAGAFESDDDSLLADLARQVGLALHNVRLDSALQESLEELQRKNHLLEESRERIVTAADESRRKIERDLHDGAQQQLVALALKVQVAKLKAGDPDFLRGLLEDLGEQVQQTIDEVRELAHGIYPPLLRDEGLGATLRRAADRAALRTTVDVRTDGRFDPAIEAAVYFCCLEAMQNAAKYAGDGAEVTVLVAESSGTLVFEVADDGVGFDVSAVTESHGFVNMRDRVGAHGGELTVRSAPGHGTVVRGELPLRPTGAEPPNDGATPGDHQALPDATL